MATTVEELATRVDKLEQALRDLIDKVMLAADVGANARDGDARSAFRKLKDAAQSAASKL